VSTIQVTDLGMRPTLRPLSFSLPSGSCTALLGTNGAGKSTLLGMLAGVMKPTSGTISIRGPICYLPEGLGVDGNLKVGGLLGMVRRLPGWEPAVADALLRDFELPLGHRVRELSQGQRVRLGLVLTLGRRARVYLLDDPFLGLDPLAQVVAERAIALRAESATMLVASQHAPASERLCDHLMFLARGGLVWCAPTEAWRARYRRVRLRGKVDVVASLGDLVLHSEGRGDAVEVLLDDPAGLAETRLRIAGARVDPLPLPLDELLMAVAA